MPEESSRVNTPFIVAIVGGGLSGTLVAVHLLRRRLTDGEGRRRQLRVSLIERFDEKVARGVAYGTADLVHLLNVPACNMSAFPDEPDHFLRWCEGRSATAQVKRDDFVPRMTYGEYLRDVLLEAEGHAPAGNFLEQVSDETLAIDADERDEGRAMLRLRRGGAFYADRVVIALGNHEPCNPHIPDQNSADFYRSSARYVRDPWRKGALDQVDLTRPVFLIGTGLTMVDVALSLKTRGQSAPIFALSRHGLLPQAHREARPLPSGVEMTIEAPTARSLFRDLRRGVKEAESAGYDWRACVNAVRPLTQTMWRSLRFVERRRFLRHARPFWEVHRHRMAPQVGRAVEKMIETNQLRIAAGRITELRETKGGDAVEVSYRERGNGGVTDMTALIHALEVGAVINCTGPASDPRRVDDALVRYLLEQEYLAPDALGLGAETSDDGALVNCRGEQSKTLFTLGPWRKPSLWETTAAPEIRAQAALLSDALIRSLGARDAFAGRRMTVETPITVREQSVYDWVI